MIIRNRTTKTLKASSLNSRGSERPTVTTDALGCTLKECPSNPASYVTFIVINTHISQYLFQLISRRDMSVVLFLVDDVLDDLFLLSLTVGKCPVCALPALEQRKFCGIGTQEIACRNFQVMNKRCHSQRCRQGYQHVNMIRHAVNAVELAVVVLAEAENIHIQFTFVFLSDCRNIIMRPENNMIEEFCICHGIETLLLDGAPRRGAWDVGLRIPVGRSDPRLLRGDGFTVLGIGIELRRKSYLHRSSIFTTLPRPFLMSSSPWRRISAMVGEDMRYSVSSIACFLAESFLRYFTAFCIRLSSSAMMLSSRNNSALSCSAVIIPSFAILPAKISTKALTAKGITLKKIERLCDEPFSMT